MGLHPTYLEAFKATHEQILTGDGPISLVDRHHLALMVTANLIYYFTLLPGLLNKKSLENAIKVYCEQYQINIKSSQEGERTHFP